MRNFIPGPTEVRPEVLAAMDAPITFSHRSEEARALYRELQPGCQYLFQTTNPVLVLSVSATGAMEMGILNAVRTRCLNLVTGAFGRRWHAIARGLGKEADLLEEPWGRGVDPARVRDALRAKPYDAVTLVYNETSTGVANPLPAVAEVVREFPDTLFLVDAVSGLGCMEMEGDAWGIDWCLAGVQKGLALPPGLTLVAVSQPMAERAATVERRGFFLDLERHLANHEKAESLTTPAFPLWFALKFQLQRILKEGLERRYQRHRMMGEMVRAWGQEQEFPLLADPAVASNSVSCFCTETEEGRALDADRFRAALAEQGFRIANGYGKLKGRAFRIGHMGDHTPDDVEQLLHAADEVLRGTA